MNYINGYIETMNHFHMEKAHLPNGNYLEAFLDGVWMMNEDGRRLELVSDYCWMNQHMMLEAA